MVKPGMRVCIWNTLSAKVAELVDAPDLGSGILDVRVRVSPFAPFSRPCTGHGKVVVKDPAASESDFYCQLHTAADADSGNGPGENELCCDWLRADLAVQLSQTQTGYSPV